MLQKILDALESANFKAAVKKDLLSCPECGAKPTSLPASGDEVISCGRCGTMASAREWCAPGGGRLGNADQPPDGTKITRELESNDAVVWTIPASGRSGGMMPFGIFWCLFTALFTFVWLFAPASRKSGNMGGWPLFLFLSVFWSVGLFMLYAGCRSKYAKHRLSVNRGKLTLRRELFGKVTEASLPADGVQFIGQTEFYQRNYRPVHGIEIRAGKRKLRFGSMLADDEKAWFVADLKRAVFGEEVNAELVQPGKVASTRQTYFSIAVPRSQFTQFLVGILLTIMGIGLLVGLYFIANSNFETPRRRSPEPVLQVSSVFDFLVKSHLVIGLIIGVGLLGMGLWLTIRGNRTRKYEVKLEGTESEIALRTANFGRVVESRGFARSEVTDIRALVSGSANGRPMKRIELMVSGKAQPIARWIDGVKADAFVEEARRALF